MPEEWTRMLPALFVSQLRKRSFMLSVVAQWLTWFGISSEEGLQTLCLMGVIFLSGWKSMVKQIISFSRIKFLGNISSFLLFVLFGWSGTWWFSTTKIPTPQLLQKLQNKASEYVLCALCPQNMIRLVDRLKRWERLSNIWLAEIEHWWIVVREPKLVGGGCFEGRTWELGDWIL